MSEKEESGLSIHRIEGHERDTDEPLVALTRPELQRLLQAAADVGYSRGHDGALEPSITVHPPAPGYEPGERRIGWIECVDKE